jgi:oxygen-dependent protoporphyrinogen oxidase
MSPRVAVAGGGITGLVAALDIARLPGRPSVTVYEATDRLGGKIRTVTFCGLPVEAGPDAILARVPWGSALIERLGLASEAVHPATGRAYVWARGRPRPLPAGLVLGVPARLAGVARSGVLSPAGLVRAGLDLVLPRAVGRPGPDPSVAALIGGRFGHEVLDRLVDPLISGINAGRADRLSLRSVAPDVAAVADRSRSLLLGLRRRPPADPEQPVFVSVRGGLGVLVERLAAHLRAEGVEIRTQSPLATLPDADAVVVATPAPAAARLVEAACPAAAAELAAIAHASVALATFAYPRAAVAHPLDAAGLLVPRSTGWLMTAATFVSSKWPALTPPGRVLIRASSGRFGDDRPMALDDAALAATLHRELSAALGIAGEPADVRVDRWPDSFPQYEPGHGERVARIEAALAREAPHVVVAGAALGGVGIASCIRQGHEAARRVAAFLAHAG